MSEAHGEDDLPIIPEGRAVLGPANLVRLGTLITVVALAVSSVASYFALKSEIRDSGDRASKALADAQDHNALDIAALRTDVQALRYDMQTRTTDTVTRSEIRLLLERLARMNANMDGGKGLNVPGFGG